MKAFKVHNAETVKQEVNLPAGTYTYSCRVIPVGTSYTFRLDNQSFTFEGLTAGVLNKRMKHTFELTEAVSFFYPSSTVGDCIYEPQIEEGVFATTPGAHPLDFERLISEAGIEIDHEALSLYAKKADVSAEIKIQTDRIDSTVGNISNDVDGVKGDMTTISQTVNSITSTVTNHTTQISTFQQTVDQIYASIEDVGSGEFSYILQRIDQIEMKVGAPGQSGSIQLALDSIALTVYDENEGMAAIIQKVNSITSTVYDEHDALLSQISQDGSNVKITASQIELEGLVTANNNFKILEDGSIEAKNGKFTGEINATSGELGSLIMKEGGYIDLPPTFTSRKGRLDNSGLSLVYQGNDSQAIEWYNYLGTFAGKITCDSSGKLKLLSSFGIGIGLDSIFSDAITITSGSYFNHSISMNGADVSNLRTLSGVGVLNLNHTTHVLNANTNYHLGNDTALIILTSVGDGGSIYRITGVGGVSPNNGDVRILMNTSSVNYCFLKSDVTNSNIKVLVNSGPWFRILQNSIVVLVYYNGYWRIQTDWGQPG